MMTLSGNILTPKGLGTLVRGQAGRIQSIQGYPTTAAAAMASGLHWMLPGFIDVRAHGAGGRDIMEDLVVAISAMTGICQRLVRGGARLLGVHLEGPYINEGRLGAQLPFARPVQSDELLSA